MADVTQTPANVRVSAAATLEQKTCGEVGGLVAGELVRIDSDDLDIDSVGKAKKTDSDAGIGEANIFGMCVGPAALNQPLLIVTFDPDLNIGGTVVPGLPYVASSNAGKVAPVSDLASGWYYSPLGYGKTATTMYFSPAPTGVQR